MASPLLPLDSGDFRQSVKAVTAASPLKGRPSVDTGITFTINVALGTPMREIRDSVIRTVMRFTQGKKRQAARLLGLHPRTISRALRGKA